jgi:hypothetical protein
MCNIYLRGPVSGIGGNGGACTSPLPRRGYICYMYSLFQYSSMIPQDRDQKVTPVSYFSVNGLMSDIANDLEDM